jgi:cysteine synthase A
VVTLICDGGERYANTYYDDGWLASQGLDVAPYLATLEEFRATGQWVEPTA